MATTTKAEHLDIELDGHVYLVEKDKDENIISKEELDGDIVLKCLLHVFEAAVAELPDIPE